MVFRKGDVESASSGDSIQSVGFFETTAADDILRVSFTHIEGDTLYVGEFYRAQNYPTPDSHKYTTAAGDQNTALILAYPLDETAPLGISDTIYIYWLPTHTWYRACRPRLQFPRPWVPA